MGLYIMYVVFSSFIIFIMVVVFKKVSISHAEINTFKFSVKNEENIEHQQIVKKNSRFNIVVYTCLIGIAVLNILFYGVGSAQNETTYFNYLLNGIQFQVVSSILFIILSVLNPFIVFPEDIIQRITQEKRSGILRYVIVNNSKSMAIRIFLSVLLITFFVYKKWLVIIPFLPEYLILQGINIMILLFIFKNIYIMKMHPIIFFRLNIVKLAKGVLYITIFTFVLIPLVPFTMMTLIVLGIDERNFSIWPLLFIVFNSLLMVLELKTSNLK